MTQEIEVMTFKIHHSLVIITSNKDKLDQIQINNNMYKD